jgi:hypothetical protein
MRAPTPYFRCNASSRACLAPLCALLYQDTSDLGGLQYRKTEAFGVCFVRQLRNTTANCPELAYFELVYLSWRTLQRFILRFHLSLWDRCFLSSGSLWRLGNAVDAVIRLSCDPCHCILFP